MTAHDPGYDNGDMSDDTPPQPCCTGKTVSLVMLFVIVNAIAVAVLLLTGPSGQAVAELPTLDRTALVELLGQAADQVGLDGDTIRNRTDELVDVTDATLHQKLKELEKATDGAIRILDDANTLKLDVDELAARRNLQSLRKEMSGVVARWMSKELADSASRFGISVRLSGNRVARPSKEILNKKAIVLVHGLDDPGVIWDTLIPELQKNNHVVCFFRYPNDGPVRGSATLLSNELKQLKELGVERISIVAHSMGGLVSREMLTNPNMYNGDGQGNASLPTVDRLITVGTPNHGSHLAHARVIGEAGDQLVRMLSGDGLLFGSILDGEGQAKTDLLPESEFLKALNARALPKYTKITVIAGRASPVSKNKIDQLNRNAAPELKKAMTQLTGALNDLVDGVGDGLVTLESSKLEGVDDYTVVEGNHVSMVRHVLPSDSPPAIPVILKRLKDDEKEE